jgi:hypothetical protein
VPGSSGTAGGDELAEWERELERAERLGDGIRARHAERMIEQLVRQHLDDGPRAA